MLASAALAALLVLPARAAADGRRTQEVSLHLDPGGRLRAVERITGVCEAFERELPSERLGFDGLRRLARLRVVEVDRAGSPAGWSTVRTRRGTSVRVRAAPGAADCSAVLVFEGQPLTVDTGAEPRLIWSLRGGGWARPFDETRVSLDGSTQTVRLAADPDGTPGAALVAVPPGALPAPAPERERRQLLLDNLHVAVGFAGLALLLAFYLFAPAWPSRDGRPWGLVCAGGAFSAGTVSAMRLAEAPAEIGAWAAGAALAAGAGAALAGAAVLGLWGLTAVLTRSALRPGAPRPLRLWLAAVACGFASFGATTAAADVFTRLVRDMAPLAVAAGAGHLVLHAAAFILRRPAQKS